VMKMPSRFAFMCRGCDFDANKFKEYGVKNTKCVYNKEDDITYVFMTMHNPTTSVYFLKLLEKKGYFILDCEGNGGIITLRKGEVLSDNYIIKNIGIEATKRSKHKKINPIFPLKSVKNGALNHWIQWSKYKICRLGQCKSKKVRFLVGIDWFWVPKSQSADDLIKFLEEHDTLHKQTIASVKFDIESNELLWQIDGTQNIVVGKCNATKWMPVQQDPITVIGGGEEFTGKNSSFYICISEGRYFLPQSIKEKLILFWEQECIDWKCKLSQCLRVLKIIHRESGFARVKYKKNPEELISVLSIDGRIAATNASLL